MSTELDYWRSAAIYLADCHAATLEHEGQLKRTSDASRRRLVMICEMAADMLDGIDTDFQARPAPVVISRCRDAVVEARRKG